MTFEFVLSVPLFRNELERFVRHVQLPFAKPPAVLLDHVSDRLLMQTLAGELPQLRVQVASHPQIFSPLTEPEEHQKIATQGGSHPIRLVTLNARETVSRYIALDNRNHVWNEFPRR